METLTLTFNSKAALDSASSELLATAISNGHLLKAYSSNDDYRIVISSLHGISSEQKAHYKSIH